MCYYVEQSGRTSSFFLRDARHQKLAEVKGTERGFEPQTINQPTAGFPQGYPSYEVITVAGITDVIEHRRMEPVFYVTDDPVVWAQLGVSK